MPELIELLFEKKNNFQDRFQSFLNQIPKAGGATASPAKPGFLTHFFLGMFSNIWYTELAEKIGIKGLYFYIDKGKPQILQVVSIIKKDNEYQIIFFIFHENDEQTTNKKNITEQKEQIQADLSAILDQEDNKEIKNKELSIDVRLIIINKDKKGFKDKSNILEVDVINNELLIIASDVKKNNLTDTLFKKVNNNKIENKLEETVAKLA